VICPPAALARLAAAGAAVLLLALPSSAAAKCRPGIHRYGAAQARTYCGRAAVTITIGHRTKTLRRGACERTNSGFSLHIGTVLLGVDSPNRPDYFGMTVGRPTFNAPAPRDGRYTGNAVVTFVIAHRRYSLRNPTVRLTGKRTEGSFSGRLLEGGRAKGTFRCR
jgi:hypothetical protein